MDKYNIQVKVKDLETRHYRLSWGSGAGRGTFIIERMADGHTTLRDTGIEAVAHYKELLRRFNISGSSFDDLCASYEYSA